MNQLQEAAIETIKKLPDDSTVDDILYEISFISQVYEGLQDSENDRLITTEELLQKVKTWGR